MERCSKEPTTRMSVLSRLNLHPIARHESAITRRIRWKSSKVDMNKFISSVYIISLAGGRLQHKMPIKCCLIHIPSSSMLKSYRIGDRGSPCRRPTFSTKGELKLLLIRTLVRQLAVTSSINETRSAGTSMADKTRKSQAVSVLL